MLVHQRVAIKNPYPAPPEFNVRNELVGLQGFARGHSQVFAICLPGVAVALQGPWRSPLTSKHGRFIGFLWMYDDDLIQFNKTCTSSA